MKQQINDFIAQANQIIQNKSEHSEKEYLEKLETFLKAKIAEFSGVQNFPLLQKEKLEIKNKKHEKPNFENISLTENLSYLTGVFEYKISESDTTEIIAEEYSHLLLHVDPLHQNIVKEKIKTSVEDILRKTPLEKLSNQSFELEFLDLEIQFELLFIQNQNKGLAVVIKDITYQKRHENYLMSLSQKLSSFIEHSIDGIIFTDAKGYIEEWNFAMERITGIHRNEIIGKHFSLIQNQIKANPDEIELNHEKIFTELLNGNLYKDSLWNQKRKLMDRKGEIKYVQEVIFPVYTEEESYIGGILRDVTQEEKAFEKLIKNEEKFRFIADSASDAFIIYNENVDITYISPSIEKITGHTIEEFLSLPREKRMTMESYFFLLDMFSAEIELVKKMNPTPSVTYQNFELQYVHKNGSIIDSEINATFVWNENLSLKGINAVIRDITLRKKAETAYRDNTEKKIELGNVQSQFISNVSHEFRTPLTLISSNVQLLYQYTDKLDKESQKKSFLRIIEAIKKMMMMLDNILMINQTENNMMKNLPSEFNFENFCMKIADEIHSILDRNINLNFRLNTHIGSVFMDKNLLWHSLINLLNNALKFSNDSSEIIFIVNKTLDNQIEIIVSDSGIGIPKKELQYITEPFFRASNAKNIKGTGLGVSIVNRCIKIMGGTLQITSEHGKGTSVTVRIPIT